MGIESSSPLRPSTGQLSLGRWGPTNATLGLPWGEGALYTEDRVCLRHPPLCGQTRLPPLPTVDPRPSRARVRLVLRGQRSTRPGGKRVKIRRPVF